ncbi:hypothetical protein D9M70_457660 [compost metagenome]
MVTQPPGVLLAGGRPDDAALRHLDGDRQPFARIETAGGGEKDLAAVPRASGVLAGRAVAAGEEIECFHPNAFRQGHRGARLVDREVPLRAGHVPVEFVVIVEETDLPAGLVGELEGMLTRVQKHLGRTGVDADAAADRLRAVGLLLAIALDR